MSIMAIILQSMGVKFSIISGEIKKEIVNDTIKIFNSPENKRGDILKLLLVTATAAEGIDFKCLRHIHILEPYWNWSRNVQIIGRGVRLNSHVDLPENERNVQPFIYLSVHGIQNNTELTTDEYILIKSSRNKQLIDSFYTAIKISAIDCPLYYENCRKCVNSNKQLFSNKSPLLEFQLIEFTS
jgi:superfamily II DNA/RNA helicase